jgi:hypothetical protein
VGLLADDERPPTGPPGTLACDRATRAPPGYALVIADESRRATRPAPSWTRPHRAPRTAAGARAGTVIREDTVRDYAGQAGFAGAPASAVALTAATKRIATLERSNAKLARTLASLQKQVRKLAPKRPKHRATARAHASGR